LVIVFIKYIAIIGCSLSGIYLLYCAYKKPESEKYEFRIKDLFQNFSIDSSSKTKLIIEGLFGILLGILGYFFWKV
jgi:hypothetical protein